MSASKWLRTHSVTDTVSLTMDCKATVVSFKKGPFETERCLEMIILICPQRPVGCSPVFMCGLKCTECSRAMIEVTCQRPEWLWV